MVWVSCRYGLLCWPTTLGLQTLIGWGKLFLLLDGLRQLPMGSKPWLAHLRCQLSWGPTNTGLAGQVERLPSLAGASKDGSAGPRCIHGM